jgi:hypothetical protein
MTLTNITNLDRIPVQNMRQALADSGLSLGQATRALGWNDNRRLERLLGLLPAGKTKVPLTHISYDEAVMLIRAWGLYPVDYGV